jgi:PHP family Zn ribbon phosphoesterase
MPWCATCNRFLSPSTVRENGTCPTCGRTVEGGGAHGTVPEHHDAPDDRPGSLPWHLWLLGAALAVYLGFRAWQGIEWVIHAL